jgi:hypothetical protein
MHDAMELSHCGEYWQTLRARPSRAIGGLILAIVLLLAGAAAWSYWTTVDVIVKSTGRVRPIT